MQTLSIAVNREAPQSWSLAFEHYGEVPHQSLVILLASIKHQKRDVQVVSAGPILSAFAVHGEIAACIIEGSGLLRAEPKFSRHGRYIFS